MRKSIKETVYEEAEYMKETKKTIREVAKYYHISKSTVHKDLKERLVLLDCELAKDIEEIFQNHTAERHIRGGESTKQKYQSLKNK